MSIEKGISRYRFQDTLIFEISVIEKQKVGANIVIKPVKSLFYDNKSGCQMMIKYKFKNI